MILKKFKKIINKTLKTLFIFVLIFGFLQLASLFVKVGIANAQSTTLVGTPTVFNSAGATSGAVNKPTGVAEGDIMIAHILHYNTTADRLNTIPSGWIELGRSAANPYWRALYYKVAGASEPTSYTFGLSVSSKFAITISAYRGNFDTSNPIDQFSNTAYTTSNTTYRAASMNVTSASSTVLMFPSVYNTTVRTFANPTTQGGGWTEDYDHGNASPDYSRAGYRKELTSSGTTGVIDSIGFSAKTPKHAFAVALRPPPVVIPGVPTLSNSDGTNQIAFNNIRQNSTTPTFRVSATSSINMNRIQLELNTSSNFSGTAYTQTFSGTYASGTSYNLTANSLSPSLPTTNGATYYARVRASTNAGTNWGEWSTSTWPYTYKSSGDPDWFQTTDSQFNMGLLNLSETTGSGSVKLSSSSLTIIQNTKVEPTVTGTTVPFVLSTQPTVGNLLVAFVGSSDYSENRTVSAPDGTWTKIEDQTNGNAQLTVWWKIVQEGDGTNYTFPISGSVEWYSGVLYEIRGADTSTPINQSSSTVGSQTSPTVTPSVIGTLALATLETDDGSTGGITLTSVSSGWTSDQVARPQYHTTYAASRDALTTSTTTGISNTWTLSGAATTPAAATVLIDPSSTLSSGYITSSPINFNFVPGKAVWGEVTINGVTSASSSIAIQVLDSNQSPITNKVCTIQNGGSSCSIGLSNLSTSTTYSTIYLKATFSSSGDIPYLNDWSVSWFTTRPQAPGVPTLYNSDGTNQIAFDNIRQNDVAPIFRVSATSSTNFDRLQIELNTASNFTGTSYTQTFSGIYASGTAYNLIANSLSPSLPTTDGATYYVRVRASLDSGDNYGAWSTTTWSYTYKSSGDPDWFQTTNTQFETGTLFQSATTALNSVGVFDKTGMYYTNFSEYTSDEKPNDWTRRWGSESNSWIVRDYATSTGGKILRVEGGATNVRRLLSWDTLDSISANLEIFFRFQVPATTQDIYVVSRGSGAAAADAVGLRSGRNTADATGKQVAYFNTTFTQVAASTFTPAVDTWYNARASWNGTSYKYKSWPATSTEPGTWDIETTSSVVNSAGWIGASAFVSNGTGSSIDVFSVNTAGGSAPTSNINENTITSPTIDFGFVPGAMNWGQISWNTTETTGNTLVQVYYNNGSGCNTVISDSILSGNESGFDVSNSPLDISSLSTSTYSQICLKASLFGNSTTSPTLNDWSVSWGGLGGVPSINQEKYRWRNDNGDEINATYKANTDTPVSSDVYPGDRLRLRIQLSNVGTGTANNYRYRLEYSSMLSSCTVWTAVPTSTSTGPWSMDWSAFVSDNSLTTDSSGLDNPMSKTFNFGYFKAAGNQTNMFNMTSTKFTELEYSIRSTSAVNIGVNYCFRVTNAGSTEHFNYIILPQIAINTNPFQIMYGGGGIESIIAPSTPSTGGGTSGGTSTEQATTTIPTSTTTPNPGGGGGDVGFMDNYFLATVFMVENVVKNLLIFFQSASYQILSLLR